MNWDKLQLYRPKTCTKQILPKGKQALSSSKQKQLRKYQRRMRKRPTQGEVRFKKALCKYFGINYPKRTRQNKKLPFKQQRQFHFKLKDGFEKGYIVDFYLPQYKIAFEVDGKSHNKPSKQRYDQARSYMLAKRGIAVFRITNDQTKDSPYCLHFIEYSIKNRNAKLQENLNIVKNQLTRIEELNLQEKFIQKYGITKCPPKP